MKHQTGSPHWAALLAFALAFAGSSIFVVAFLRPFHFGLAFLAFAFLQDPIMRTRVRQSLALKLTLALALLLALQLLWVVQFERYLSYAVMLIIGLAYTTLGETLSRSSTCCVKLLFPLVIFWFALALFPIFDAWTGSTRFRSVYVLTGGVWDNINDMATALVFANLIILLEQRRPSLPLAGLAWFYVLALDRRADMLGMIVLIATYALLFPRRPHQNTLLQLFLTLLLSTAAALLLHTGSFRGLPLSGIFDSFTHYSERQSSSIGTGESSTIRVDLLLQMINIAQQMHWWEWLAGLGVGQLNLTWPPTGQPWASPHLFWLEMLFHLGFVWFALLIYLFVRLDNLGRGCLLSAIIAGCAPSSIIYFQPFWIFLGILLGHLRKKQSLCEDFRRYNSPPSEISREQLD